MRSTSEGLTPFEDHLTWYMVVGDIEDARSGLGPAPLVLLHGGPGASHDYLLALADLADSGRTLVFYDQIGGGNSSHYPDRGAEFYTVDLFVRELANLIDYLGIGHRYHVLGQSWGGILAQEHGIAQPPGLRSLVISNSAVSLGRFAEAATGLRAMLPPEVEATLRRHESEGTTDDPEYAEACSVFYARHLCRLDPWPEEVVKAFDVMEADPTVYHTTNGPSEFHVIGSFRDCSTQDRLDRITAPTLVISGRYDEATPDVQSELAQGITNAEQVIMEESSHLPFWEERARYVGIVGAFLGRHD